MYRHKNKGEPQDILDFCKAALDTYTYMAMEICVKKHHCTGEAMDSI